MNRYLKALTGLSWASIVHALRERSLGELETGSLAGAKAVETLPSKPLRSIPAVALNRLMEGSVEVRLWLAKYEDGMLPLEDSIILAYILVREQPSVVLEIGTYMGHATRAIAENCPAATVHTLDLPPDFDLAKDKVAIPKDDLHLIEKRTVGREFAGLPCAERIRQHFGDSATWDFQAAAGATFFFIDGAHTYEYIKNDTEKCLALCGGHGIFLWHDVDDRHPGVLEYLCELRRSGRDVIRFANSQLAYLKVG